MKKLILIILLFYIAAAGFSQQAAAVWYFGDGAGIDFSSGSPVSLNDGNMVAEAGCSAISNSQGQLQFYTNGAQVWNRNHQIMANGDSLYGSQYLNQNSIIIPKPLSGDSIYYLFTIVGSDSLFRFTYSVVNMKKENGLGELVVVNDAIADRVIEKISAVKHCNDRDYWIITHDNQTSFQSLLLTNNGIETTVLSKNGLPVKADIGYLKVSPAGDKLVLPVNNEEVLAQLFDFDNKTGKVSNPLTIYRKINNTYAFGFEFSPDGNLLYMTTGSKNFELWQFDLRNKNEADFNSKAIHITSGNNFAMQLAPDNKIYIARENSSFLNVINSPDKAGKDCNYQKKAFKLSKGISFKGLPNFVQSWFYQPSFDVFDACYGDSTTFVFNRTSNIESLTWKFDPGEGNAVIGGNRFAVKRLFNDTTTYHVTLLAYHCEVVVKVEKEVEVVSYPQSVLVPDTMLCKDCIIIADPGIADSYQWSTGTSGRYLQISEPGMYTVLMKNNECTVTDSVSVSRYSVVVSVPNAFTPNNDGLNDLFKVVANDDLFNYKLQIYDRNGTVVFYSEDYNMGWDGSYKGTPCPVSSYAWYLSFDSYQDNGMLSHKTKQGFVTIIK